MCEYCNKIKNEGFTDIEALSDYYNDKDLCFDCRESLEIWRDMLFYKILNGKGRFRKYINNDVTDVSP